MVTAVIFDVDGTLVDSNELHVESWDRAFRHFGKQFSAEKLHENIGKGGDQYLPAFLNEEELRTIGPKIDKYRADLFKKEYLPRVRPFPKVRELLLRVREQGKRIALGTSGKREELKHHQKVANIEDLVDAQTTADDADHSKPAPDIFVAVLEKLGNLSAREVVAVGDSPYDAEAAGKAGMATIGLLCGGFSEAKLRGAGAIAIFRDPADLLEKYETSPISGK